MAALAGAPSVHEGLPADHRSCDFHFDFKVKKGPAIVTNLVVPKTGGMNTTKVNVVKWLKNEGDPLKQGEPVVELETEKVSYELDAPVDGVLLKIEAREPAEVEVGGVLGYIGQAGDKAPGRSE